MSDNITTTHLLNVKRLAYALHDPPRAAYTHAPDVRGAPDEVASASATSGTADTSTDRVERIVARVLQELGGGP